MLVKKGYKVSVYLFNTKEEFSSDCETNKEQLADVEDVDFHEVISQFVPSVLTFSFRVLKKAGIRECKIFREKLV